jgi:oligopeptidase A
MNVAVNRRASLEGIKPPVAWLTCNFQAPVGSRPAMLTHDEVTTLFHEFGHGLHHVLTDMQEPRVSGLNGVEWDAVELPSQFLENFAWEWDQIQRMTAHFQTGAPLPESLYKRMLEARHFMMGMYLLRQLEFGLFDLELHQSAEPCSPSRIMDLLADIRHRVAVAPYPEWNRFPHAFSHIFAGGYAAGYYSYLWAEVLSADCYMAFTEEIAGEIRALDPATRSSLGERFLRELLALGSLRPAIEHFKAFMQREPRLDALLNLYGLGESSDDGAIHAG